MTATLSTKGQLVIPTRLRKAMRLRAGDKIALHLEGERLVVQRQFPARARLVKAKSGRMVLVAPAGAPPMTTERVNVLLAEFP